MNATIKGFRIFDTNELRVQTYCMKTTDKEIVQCPSVMSDVVNKLVEPPVNRETGTDDVYGFLVTKMGVVIFKTLHKPSSGDKSLLGAECSNDSVLKHHHPRINSAVEAITKYAPDDPILPLILDNSSKTAINVKQKELLQKSIKIKYSAEGVGSSVDFTHLHSLSLRQVCPYMEFILRYMEMRKIGGIKWCMNLVESYFALPGGKKAIKMS
jgi:hypothetical protein